MRCPTCRKEFHPQPDFSHGYWADDQPNSYAAFAVYGQKCPSCHSLVLGLEKGRGRVDDGEIVIDLPNTDLTIYPIGKDSVLSTDIPDSYRADYEEARAVLDISPKASAALSRRLMQKILREQLGIKKRDLSLEIDAFIESQAPVYLADAVDAVRHIGNFAAHPLKFTNTGDIVEVEDGEADWTLQVVEALLDFAFVQPARLKQRRDVLNNKLQSLGKPLLKTSA
jgi:hypothetical protein